MEKYVINGGIRLDGKVQIESAKNSVLPMLAGAILTNEDVVIKNCPKIKDVFSMINILNALGAKTEFIENDLLINASFLNSYTITENLSKELRSSVFMLGALISKTGKAKVCYPGGCDIGARPVNIHISGLKSLGVSITEVLGEIVCTSEQINGKSVYLEFPSVGATENLILASVFCKGNAKIYNAAKEPEVVDLINFLNSMGAKITGGGSSVISVCGVKKLHGTVYKPISDRIEAGTFLIAGAITGGEVEVSNVNAENISSLIHKLCNNTCKISIKNDIIRLKSGRIRKAFNVETSPYPGFPTDLQAQTMALLSVSYGASVIVENIFEMRFKHVPELIKMGANVKICERTAIINGVKALHGASVKAEDLRGGAALVLAAVSAEGRTVVSGINHIERGYRSFDKKLAALGADINKKK